MSKRPETAVVKAAVNHLVDTVPPARFVVVCVDIILLYSWYLLPFFPCFWLLFCIFNLLVTPVLCHFAYDKQTFQDLRNTVPQPYFWQVFTRSALARGHTTPTATTMGEALQETRNKSCFQGKQAGVRNRLCAWNLAKYSLGQHPVTRKQTGLTQSQDKVPKWYIGIATSSASRRLGCPRPYFLSQLVFLSWLNVSQLVEHYNVIHCMDRTSASGKSREGGVCLMVINN